MNARVTDTLDVLASRITVIGVGGAGGNAVSNMIRASLEGVEFLVCNTDAQALQHSAATQRLLLGAGITRGLGAGSKPGVGRAAAEEALDQLSAYLDGSDMVFITAGMGGGTGTGAAPVIARAARERNILTVGVVTKPFQFEGAHRMRTAEAGIQELQQFVDTLIVIPNQNLFRIANEKTTFADAFKMADEVLHSGVRGVTDLMVMPGLINLDFADIRTVMSEMGKAMMGTGEATGERRAIEAAEAAISNPLLDEVSLKTAKAMLINITAGMDIALFEVDEAVNRVKAEVDPDANIIFGSTFDPSMEGRLRVSVVATGIEADSMTRVPPPRGRIDGVNVVDLAANRAALAAARPVAMEPAPDLPSPDLSAAAEPDSLAASPPPQPEPAPVAARETAVQPARETPWLANPFASPVPAPSDAEDLEIPAFLRRSSESGPAQAARGIRLPVSAARSLNGAGRPAHRRVLASALQPDRTRPVSPVDCSVYAPPVIAAGSGSMVQAFLHLSKMADEARALATEFDAEAERRGFQTLDLGLPLNAKVDFHLSVPGLTLDEPVRRVLWRGGTVSAQFVVEAPKNIPRRDVFGRLRVSVEGVPVGNITFKIAVSHVGSAPAPVRDGARPYRNAFVSYASPDRNEVLKRVQMMPPLGINVFQDVLSLDPGARWERKLYSAIDECDVFLLFWSNAARDSEGVRKELNYALTRKGEADSAPPDIVPVLIEGPPPVPPPEELAHLHFNDYLIYLMDR